MPEPLQDVGEQLCIRAEQFLCLAESWLGSRLVRAQIGSAEEEWYIQHLKSCATATSQLVLLEEILKTDWRSISHRVCREFNLQ